MTTPHQSIDKKAIETKVTSLYIHFPYCKHLCNYCDFYKLKLDDQKSQQNFFQFEEYLNNSWEAFLPILEKNDLTLGPLETLYFGGGTPSLWGERGIDFIREFFHKKNFALSDTCEWTIEVDPGATTKKELEKWKEVGVNRFSLGVQTLDKNLFSYMDRNYSLSVAYDVIGFLSEMNANFSVDFLLGIPFTPKFGRSIESELNEVLVYGAKHVSLYFLTVPKHYIHYNSLPQDEWICDEFVSVCSTLEKRGFNHYEVANFGLPGYESRHNKRYWSHDSILALGPSAVGFISNVQGKMRFRWSTNWRETSPKCDFEYLSPLELNTERIYLTLRQGRPFKAKDLPISKEGYGVLDVWEKENYLKAESRGDKEYVMTPKGWLILDTLIQQILTFSL